MTLSGDAMISNRASASNRTVTFTGGITSGGTNGTLTLNTFGNATVANNQLTISTNSVNLGAGGTLNMGFGLEPGGSSIFNLNVGSNTWGTTIVRGLATAATSSNVTLNLGAANALGNSSSILQLGNTSTALEGITVNLNGNNQTIGGLRSFTGSGGSSANGTRTITSTSAATLTIDNSSGTNYLYNGIISGSISLIKSGSALQTLSLLGNNNYSGSTTISGGTLRVTNTVSAPAGSTFTRADFTNTTLAVTFSAVPPTGNYRLLPGSTTQTYASVSLVGASGRTGSYNSSTSTLTIS
jgi:hypothetical protein